MKSFFFFAGTNNYALDVADSTNSEISLTASSEKTTALAATKARLDHSDANAAWMPTDSDNGTKNKLFNMHCDSSACYAR